MTGLQSAFVFRRTRDEDIEAGFEIRGRTRQNPIAKAQLAALGITPALVRENFAAGTCLGWVCEVRGQVVGFCTGDLATGEVLVLAVLAEYEGRKIGSGLLSRLVESMRAEGVGRLWLTASRDATIRAHGFYRAHGWQPTGEVVEGGDEVLELPP